MSSNCLAYTGSNLGLLIAIAVISLVVGVVLVKSARGRVALLLLALVAGSLIGLSATSKPASAACPAATTTTVAPTSTTTTSSTTTTTAAPIGLSGTIENFLYSGATSGTAGSTFLSGFATVGSINYPISFGSIDTSSNPQGSMTFSVAGVPAGTATLTINETDGPTSFNLWGKACGTVGATQTGSTPGGSWGNPGAPPMNYPDDTQSIITGLTSGPGSNPVTITQPIC